MGKKKIISLLTTIIVTLVTAFSTTLAWFETAVQFDDGDANVTGSSMGAYYDYGKGTFEEPYGIRTPRHLYNLAWLQYLGQYNDVNEGVREQFYFQLADDIDMTGWILPPIGTTTYPFIGNFNGRGFIISNLKVSNSFNDYNKTPDIVSSVTGVDIIGMFGVVGSLNTPVTDDNKAAVSMTDSNGQGGTKTGTYNSQINELKNFGLNNLTVSTQTNSSLVGLAAGYVNGNVNGIGVANSNINIAKQNTAPLSYTNNLSDYSLVGYATDSFKSNIQRITKSADTPDVQFTGADSSGDKWGGSISMKTMYERLLSIKNKNTTTVYGPVEKSVYGDTEISSNNWTSYNNGSTTYTFEYTGAEEIDSKNDTISNYTFASRQNNDQFIYLSGKQNLYTETTHYGDFSTVATGDTFYLKSGNNYMVLNNNNPTNTTNITNATLLNLDNYNRIKNNASANYLYNNNGTLQRTNSTTTATRWTISGSALTSTAANGFTYALRYNNGWGLVPLTQNSDYYLIHSGTNYLSRNLTSVNQANATHFYTDTTGIYCYDTNGTTKLYLGLNATVNNGSRRTYYTNPSLTISATPTLYFANNNNTQIRVTYAQNNNNNNYNTTRYLRYNNGWTTDTTQRTVNSDHEIVDSDDASNYPLTYVKVSEITNDSLGESKSTYFPLSYDTTVNTDVFDYNTGYVVSGANFNGGTTNMPGDIRVSYYTTSNISNSRINNSTSALDIVTRTASSGGFSLISDSFNSSTQTNPSSAFSSAGISTTRVSYSSNAMKLEKYEKSRGYFDQILNTDNPDSRIYGLHFMDALIDINKTIRIPKAVINEVEYNTGNTNGGYELPEDCIDFNLKSKGYINFFAGTYFTGNTTFFSLHEIERDNSYDITSIKEISKIYHNDSDSISARQNKPFIYEYVGGGNNLGANDVKGNLAFDMNWVTNPTMVTNAVYYFEIPVNTGEYALGSVSGKNGAYLMYLDIGASANSTDVTVVRETIRTVTDSYAYPIGIDFVDASTISTITFTSIVGGNSSAVYLVKPTSGNIAGIINYNYVKASGNVMFDKLTCAPPAGESFSGNVGAVFIANTAECYYNTTKLTAVYINSETRVTKRKTEYYYDVNSHEVSYEIFERTEDGEGEVIQDYISVKRESLGEDADFYTSEVQLRVSDDDAITLIKFRYDKLPGNTVTITPFYNPETFTYNFEIECTSDLNIYVESLVEETTINDINITFTYKFNDTTVTEGNFYTITGTGV